MPSFKLLEPCDVALFHLATIERPVAPAARGRNYRTAKQEGEKKKSGRSKGGGRREPRPRLHPWRPAFTDRPPCLQSKDNGFTVERIPVAFLRMRSRSVRSSRPRF